jgi:hypothetical protein
MTADDWQPIETFFERSDKTGEVLLYFPGRGVTVGKTVFTGGHVWEVDGEKYRGHTWPEVSKAAGPTHWRPLPPPPRT